jgi:[NiFe] hydrogenase diaphorase moiety small subunit
MSGQFTIDNQPISFEEGQTIMDAAMAAEVYIPHLCHNPEFRPHGSCKLCTVKINGRPASACTSPAVDGAVVENNTDELMEDRRVLLKMLFVEGNHVCPGCEKSGRCQLQAVAYYCNMLAPEFTHFYPQRAVDASHPEVMIDFNRCILCNLCVRASRDVDGKNVFAISGRGIKAHLVIDSPSGKLGESNFDVEDRAAQVCPVGAILPKHQGFDMPIGQRLYDQEPVSVVGDVARQEEE